MSLGNFPDFLLNFSVREMNGEEKHFYQFKSFRLDVGERQLLHHGTVVPLAPKVFDVLVALVERNGHLVEKDELLRVVWSDSFVEEANIARIVHTLRKVLGEDENGNKFIETVAKKGYRFVAKVTEVPFGEGEMGRKGEGETVVEKSPRLPVTCISPSRFLPFSPSDSFRRRFSERGFSDCSCCLLIFNPHLPSIRMMSNQSPFCL